MYTFGALPPAKLTCRHWYLGRNGCNLPRCPYAHEKTGILSAPSPYACWKFNKGGCQSQDQCLYTHLRLEENLQEYSMASTYPQWSFKDFKIADAAVRNGFKGDNVEALSNLVRAVKSANRRRRPNRPYNSRIAPYQGGIGPGIYQPGVIRPRPGLIEVYQTSKAAPAVPAFIKPAAELIKDITNLTKNRPLRAAPRQRSMEPKLEPGEVDLRSLNKKRSVTEACLTQTNVTKRTKIDTETHQEIVTINSQEIIDLTSEVNTELTVAKGVMGTGQVNASEQIIFKTTTSALRRCAEKLKNFVQNVGLERKSLRERWDIDEALKLQTVTDHLAELNSNFFKAEDTVNASIKLVEQMLLRR